MLENKFSGADLENALANNSLEKPGLTIVGMVKSSVHKEHIGFTRSGCDAWMDLPITMIEQAEHIGQQGCKDHSHPVMRITLAEPEEAYAKIFAAIAAEPASFNNRINQPAFPAMSHTPVSGRFPTEANAGFSGELGNVPFSPPTHGGFTEAEPGSMRAWGCWESTCTRCTSWRRVCNGTACWNHCDSWISEPCTRCIWPF